MKMINRILAVAAAVSLGTLAACTPDSGGPSAPPPPASSAAPAAGGSATPSEGVITIKDFAFEVPGSVKPGSMVTVTNADNAPHTVTAKGKGGFDMEVQGGGTVIVQAPDDRGEYGIICSFHPQMKGTLVVK